MPRVPSIKTMLPTLIAAWFFIFSAYSQSPVTLLTESFETGNGTTPPAGWVIEQVSGTIPGISIVSSAVNPVISAAADGSKFVSYNSAAIASGSTRLKMATPISTTEKNFILVECSWFQDPAFPGNNDQVALQWSVDSITWNTDSMLTRYDTLSGWKIKYLMLPTGVDNQPQLWIGFLFTSANGHNCALDKVRITGEAIPPSFITLGTGTTSVAYPFSTLFMGARTQMLYTASQLTAAGAIAGNISSVGFNFSSATPQVMSNFTIKMGMTMNSSLTGWISQGMNIVYQSDYSVTGTGWRDFAFPVPFNWNGTSNVVVEVCFGDNGSYSNNSLVFASSSSAKTWHYHADTYAGCTGSATGAVQTMTPNIRFQMPPSGLGGAVMGIVRDAISHQPLPCSRVEIGSRIDTTDENGFYIHRNINAGAVTILSINWNGYTFAQTPSYIVSGQSTWTYIDLSPGPTLTGIVTDVSTGVPIVGASITLDGVYRTRTVSGGYYSTGPLSIMGAKPVVVSKTGYDNFTGSVTLTAGMTSTFNAALLPTAYPPHSITATPVGTPTTAISLAWEQPWALYELLYDDGIPDSCISWSPDTWLQAVKFTPQGYPCRIFGGSFDRCSEQSFACHAAPPLGNIMIYLRKADGAGGAPGTVLDSVLVNYPFTGFRTFYFTNPVTLVSGDFYLVWKQLGTSANYSGISIDTTNPAGRSFSKPVSGGVWTPVNGNVMMRAHVEGPGVALPSDHMPLSLSYQVFRMMQGNEGTQASWTSIYYGPANTTIDYAWPTLPCGPWRWAVRAVYSPPGSRSSAPVFSNVIGKCWTADIHVCVNPSCTPDQKEGTLVRLANTLSDTVYTALTDTSGCVHFPTLWKGTYLMTISRFSYPDSVRTVTLMKDSTFIIDLIQPLLPPSGLNVDSLTLLASWSPSYAGNPCFSQYNIFLDGAPMGNTTDTTFQIPSNQVTFGRSYQVCVEAVYNIGISSQICKIFVAHYLPPVTQLSATPFQNTCYLSWNKPAGPSGDPSGLIGYNIYRNGTMVHYIPHKDTTHFNDVGLLPGTYSYEVRARYDLSVFGWTGQFGEALSPGSVPVFIAGSLHFMPVWMGVPINPMSIVVHQALCTGTSLGTGDEIGVFDGTVCVGMVKLVSAINPSHPPVITVSEDNPATPAIDGYIAGDSILCKIWRVIPPGEFSNVSYTFPYAPLYAQGHFQINDTSVVSLFTFNVPPALQVSDTTVTSGQTTCFNATGHLTVAGNGSLFKVLPGGSATMIAGLKISYFPGTKVFSGGYMHGYISPDGLYCGGMPPFAPITPEEKDLRVSENSGDFILYPNPASDKLFVKSIRPSATGAIAMEIFNVVGKRMIRITLQDPASTFVDIALFPPGLYLAVIRSDGGRQIGRFVISGR